jgi:hypothetical protein
VSTQQYGALAGAMALNMMAAMDRSRSLGKLVIQSTESRDRAIEAAEAKRARKNAKRAMIAAAQEPQG